jgi:hypothetical protein
MVTANGAGTSHDLIAHLDKLASRPGHQLIYSVSWDLGHRERTAITAVPEQAWQIAVDHRGEVRERRTDDARADRGCTHSKCWIQKAHVTELRLIMAAITDPQSRADGMGEGARPPHRSSPTSLLCTRVVGLEQRRESPQGLDTATIFDRFDGRTEVVGGLQVLEDCEDLSAAYHALQD